MDLSDVKSLLRPKTAVQLPPFSETKEHTF